MNYSALPLPVRPLRIAIFQKKKTVKKKVKRAVVRRSGRTISPEGWPQRSGGHYAFVHED
jgi:hypothetical protein